MRYYQSNAIYERLKELNNRSFAWAAANAWTLVYGNERSDPIALALVAGGSWRPQKEIVSAVKYLGEKSGVPKIEVYFNDTIEHIDHVEVRLRGSDLKTITLDELKETFSSFGLPVAAGRASKSINDASSSAYHNWQRAHLGRITVSDIDLFRVNELGIPSEIIELKRSYIGLDSWKPFAADYANFNLLMELSKSSSLAMNIAYNVRHKSPFFDDASRLSVFNYSDLGPRRLGIFTFEEFVSGRYRR